jgi:hypothetical protein
MTIKFLSQIKKNFNMIFKNFWKVVYLIINILIYFSSTKKFILFSNTKIFNSKFILKYVNDPS